jgi:hypothetical protein
MPNQRAKKRPDPRTQLWLRVSAGLCALVSLAALVAHVFHVLPMVYFLNIFGLPSLLLLFALAAFGKWIDAKVFVNCMAVGLIGGFVATLAYDGVRYVMQHSSLFQYNGFISIYIFGSWITGQSVDSRAAAVAGWLYHFWNGISFGILYALIFGRRHWLYGMGYGMFMEACMLGLFPFFLKVTNRVDFITLSMIGHMVYGAVLGLIAQRYARNWSEAR